MMLEQHSRTSSTNTTNAVELATLGRWQNKQTTVDDDQVSREGVDDRTTSRRNEGERGERERGEAREGGRTEGLTLQVHTIYIYVVHTPT